MTVEHLRTEIARRLMEYLKTSEGEAEMSRAKQQLLSQEAERWFAAAEGRASLQEARGRLVDAEMAKDPDIFERAVRDEIARRVDIWANSPAGQEAIEQERQQRMRKESQANEAASKSREWIAQVLSNMNKPTEPSEVDDAAD